LRSTGCDKSGPDFVVRSRFDGLFFDRNVLPGKVQYRLALLDCTALPAPAQPGMMMAHFRHSCPAEPG
jgi:hypothetical protein